jgi:hypothetical protein
LKIRRRASMESTACSGAPVRRGQGLDVYKGNDLLARPRPSRRHGAHGLGLRARQGVHTAVTTGLTAVRLPGRARCTAGTQREEGEDFKGPWDAQSLGMRGARTPRAARRGAVRRGAAQDVSVCLRLTVFFQKFLNRSAQSDE